MTRNHVKLLQKNQSFHTGKEFNFHRIGLGHKYDQTHAVTLLTAAHFSAGALF